MYFFPWLVINDCTVFSAYLPHPQTHTPQGEANQSAVLRAYHPDEVSKQPHLEVDTLYYLQHQVHAVVSRLCEPVEGLGAATIAEFLGLDPSGYVKRDQRTEEDGGVAGETGEKHDPFEGVALPRVLCLRCCECVDIRGAKVSWFL